MSDVVTDLSELVASVVEPLIENKEELEVTGIDEEDGNILMSVKAGDGLFQSTKYTDCDEVQELFE